MVTQRTGVKDESNTVVNQRLPGLLAEVCGVEVEDYDSLSNDMQNSLEFTISELREACATVGVLCDILKPTTATVVAQYTQDYYAGKPAITQNIFGKGNAFYVGTELDSTGMDWLLELTCKTAGVQPAIVPAGVELSHRSNGNSSWLFILNHSAEKVNVSFEGQGLDLLTSTQVNGSIELESSGVAIIQFSAK